MKKELSNGIRIVYDYMPWVKSVTTSIWIKAGSRSENPEINGVSHFIEHMLFKGTTNRSAKQIANEIDFIGGMINAFTSKEYTCYYTKTLDENIDTAIDVLSDILLNSVFDEKEIEKERSVILEEINMYEDSPEDLSYELLSENIWKGSPLGYPVAGTKETVSSLTREKILNYKNSLYTTPNIVVSVAGNFDEKYLIDTFEKKLSALKSNSVETTFNKEKYIKSYTFKRKDIEQSNLCFAIEGAGHEDKNLYPLMIASNMLGGTMSSILFQKVREEKGLCYTIYASLSPALYNGSMYVYAATNPAQTEELIKVLFSEINEFKNTNISLEELNRNKQQLKGSLLLSYESTSTRMTSMGKSEILQKKVTSQEEILKKIEDVTLDQLHDVMNNIIDTKKASISLVSNFKDDTKIKELYEKVSNE